jgi:hypothetical protein
MEVRGLLGHNERLIIRLGRGKYCADSFLGGKFLL